MRLIGINGFKEAGKDTTFLCIESLAHERSQVATRRGFADKLKIMAALAIGFEGNDQFLIETMNCLKEDGGYLKTGMIENSRISGLPIIAEKQITGRKYLQLFGGKARAVFGDTFWIDLVLPNPRSPGTWVMEEQGQLHERFEFADYGCVTDVRYPNEAERILALGGEVWEVINPNCVSDGDASEQPLPRDLVTLQIPNHGTIEDLRQIVERNL